MRILTSKDAENCFDFDLLFLLSATLKKDAHDTLLTSTFCTEKLLLRQVGDNEFQDIFGDEYYFKEGEEEVIVLDEIYKRPNFHQTRRHLYRKVNDCKILDTSFVLCEDFPTSLKTLLKLNGSKTK